MPMCWLGTKARTPFLTAVAVHQDGRKEGNLFGVQSGVKFNTVVPSACGQDTQSLFELPHTLTRHTVSRGPTPCQRNAAHRQPYYLALLDLQPVVCSLLKDLLLRSKSTDFLDLLVDPRSQSGKHDVILLASGFCARQIILRLSRGRFRLRQLLFKKANAEFECRALISMRSAVPKARIFDEPRPEYGSRPTTTFPGLLAGVVSQSVQTMRRVVKVKFQRENDLLKSMSLRDDGPV